MLSNCYLYVKTRFPNLPRTAVIKANVSDAIGDVAVFNYSGVWHYAVVESIGYGTFKITETNFGGDYKNTRDVSFADKSLVGFFSL